VHYATLCTLVLHPGSAPWFLHPGLCTLVSAPLSAPCTMEKAKTFAVPSMRKDMGIWAVVGGSDLFSICKGV